MRGSQVEGRHKQGPKTVWEDLPGLYEIYGGEENFWNLVEKLSWKGNQGAQLAAVLRARAEGKTIEEIAKSLSIANPNVLRLEDLAFEALSDLHDGRSVVLHKHWSLHAGMLDWDNVFSEYGGELRFFELLNQLSEIGAPWDPVWGKELANILREFAQGATIVNLAEKTGHNMQWVRRRIQWAFEAMEKLFKGESVSPPRLDSLYLSLIDQAGGVDALLIKVDELSQLGEKQARCATILQARLEGETAKEVGEKLGITKQRVQQLERDAIDELRKLLSKAA